MLRTKSKYYYTRLDNDGQRIYDSILSAWENRNREASLVMNPLLAKADMQKIVQFVAWDNPGLFYVDFSRIIIARTYRSMSVQAEFIFNKRQIGDAENQLRQAINKLLISAPLANLDKMDQYQKELALHNVLVQKISYEDDGISHSSTSIVGGLLLNKAVCEGYAKTFKLLCDKIGLSCILVAGKATSCDSPQENHAWNIVKLNGVCAHVDVTWDSTMRTGNEPCYDHFNITDDDIAQDHVWDKVLLPACTSTANNYFHRTGNLVRNDAEFRDYINAQLKAGRRSFAVKLLNSGLDKEQVMRKVNNILAQSPLLGKGRHSFRLRYNSKRRVAAITLM